MNPPALPLEGRQLEPQLLALMGIWKSISVAHHQIFWSFWSDRSSEVRR